MGARLAIYGIAGAFVVALGAFSYALHAENQRLEAQAAELRNGLETSEARADALADEIRRTDEQLAAVRRDRSAIDAHFDALSEQLDEVVRNATDAQRACLALEHGDAIGRLLRTEPGNDNGG